jgi:hypothetical protein
VPKWRWRRSYEASTVDKTIWNPRAEIDLTSRAVSDESNSFRFILGKIESDLFSPGPGVAGLGLFDQKNAITATTPIATAFKFGVIRRRKMGSWLLDLSPERVSFLIF